MKRQLLLLLALIPFFNVYAQIVFQDHIIDGEDEEHVYSVFTSDIDGDGDLDNEVVWHENTDGQGNFGMPHFVTSDGSLSLSICSSDLDMDGDMDVLSTSIEDGKIVWYENMDGQGNFSEQIVLSTSAFDGAFVRASDMDNDGDMDVLSAISGDDSRIVWYENVDGLGSFSEEQIISTNLTHPGAIRAADINGDGKMDVVSASSLGSVNIVWHENLGLTSNIIEGTVTMDVNGNGCDSLDMQLSNLTILTESETESYSAHTAGNGYYQIFPEEGDFTTSIAAGVPDNYTVTPESYTFVFDGINNVETADFCLEPIQFAYDLDIQTLIPLKLEPLNWNLPCLHLR